MSLLCCDLLMKLIRFSSSVSSPEALFLDLLSPATNMWSPTCNNLSIVINLPIPYIDTLLCVSCPSATEFLAILFLPLARSSSNSSRSFQRFGRTLVPNFIHIRQRVKNFPIDPHCKNCPFSAMLKRCRKWVLFTMGVYGKKGHLLSNPVEISPQS